MVMQPLSINSARLKTLLEGINGFGFNPESGGYNRPGLSNEDTAVRAWFSEAMRDSGLAVSRDAAGNLFGRLGPADKPCVMVGSHLDTVPEGGAFDGALGAAIGLECARCLVEAGREPPVPVVVVATSEEEGRFGGMLGSQTISGQLPDGWVESAEDADGVRLYDAMLEQGLAPDAINAAAWPQGSIKAFVELHVEQGPVLESEGLAIGIVDGVSGVLVLGVTLEGEANHSGTTPMHLRADAFAGLSEIGAAIPHIIDEIGTDQSRITIGKVDLQPNFPHTIPGQADFSLIIRDTSVSVMAALRTEIERAIDETSKRHRLTRTIEERSYIAPQALDSGVREAFLSEVTALGYSHRVMPSGAGHDAQTMQGFCPAGLVFVPSRNGISHAPQEWTDWTDIEKGAQLMLNTVIALCGLKEE